MQNCFIVRHQKSSWTHWNHPSTRKKADASTNLHHKTGTAQCASRKKFSNHIILIMILFRVIQAQHTHCAKWTSLNNLHQICLAIDNRKVVEDADKGASCWSWDALNSDNHDYLLVLGHSSLLNSTPLRKVCWLTWWDVSFVFVALSEWVNEGMVRFSRYNSITHPTLLKSSPTHLQRAASLLYICVCNI